MLNYARCDDVLDSRRNWSLGLLAGAFVVPRAISFVTGRNRETFA